MAKKIGYTIIVSVVSKVDEANNRKDTIFNIDVKDIDVRKLLQFILENTEFIDSEKNPNIRKNPCDAAWLMQEL